ncbi:hypothetical protein QAD02_014749 [Eretmocerus hayati]|uniref:Uncharacterized protein n=1 Tax=Eretmocerus hayati TaxID=131215 RepID=A0ACC2P6C7_9HYME|nr:hypothetical protein QAD02_014749 [Eretmocerus hayati]
MNISEENDYYMKDRCARKTALYRKFIVTFTSIQISTGLAMRRFRVFVLLVLGLSSHLTSFGNTQELQSLWRSLNNGLEIPMIGFGAHFRTPVNEEELLLRALKTGYRLFDTAWVYPKSEEHLGNALKKWFEEGGNRDDLVITTKLPLSGLRAGDVEIYLNDSLKNLGLDYIDMYLIHGPIGMHRLDNLKSHVYANGTGDFDFTTDHLSVWRAMEDQVKAGRVRSIGLSTFNASQILRIWNQAEIKPSNLQIEGNLYIQQKELRTLCNELGIVVTAFFPIGSNVTNLPAPMDNSVVQKIAEKYGKTPTQILLNYSIHLGFVPIPNTKNPDRMRENLDIFDFELDYDDFEELSALDQYGKYRKFDFEGLFKGSSKHPEYPFADRRSLYT